MSTTLQGASRTRCISALVGLTVLLLIGCDGGDTRVRDGSAASLQQDATLPAVGGPSAIEVTTRVRGASADASEADLVLDWSLAPHVRPALNDRSRLVVRLDDGQGGSRVLSRQRIADDGGEIDVTVPADDTGATLTLGLEGLSDGIIDDLPAHTTLTLPELLRPPSTDLTTLTSLSATLRPDSYASVVEDGRRLHRFALQVDATLADGRVTSVTGLDAAASHHFKALEFGVDDPESPVRASWASEPVTVYLIMDVSSSVSLAGAADTLLDAVSRTLLALAPVATFDYRVFASDVRRLPSLRDLAFDDLEDSGTAFYRAIDTTLDDIEQHADGDVVIIAFTDGQDFASRNFYPALLSHRQVRDHVASRLRNVRAARATLGGKRLEAHVVSLGSDIDAEALQSIADAGGGQWFASYQNDTISGAFAHLTDGVRGVYELEYSSQQLPDDTEIVVEVHAGDVHAEPVRLPTRAGLAPSD